MDSDVKFDKNIIHELIIDIKKSNADIIAPLICIENNGSFKNNYFYDTLAFKNEDNENFHIINHMYLEILKKVE